MPSATPRTRIIQVRSDTLHKLLNEISKRAYDVGYKDGRDKNRFDPGKVEVKESSICKIK